MHSCAPLARHWVSVGRMQAPPAPTCAPMSPTGAPRCASERSLALSGAHMCPTSAPVGRTWAPTGASGIPTAGQRVEDRKGANFGSGSQLDHSARRGIRLRSLDHPCWRSGSQLDHSENRQIRLRSLDHPCWNIIIIEQLYSVSGIGSGSRRICTQYRGGAPPRRPPRY